MKSFKEYIAESSKSIEDKIGSEIDKNLATNPTAEEISSVFNMDTNPFGGFSYDTEDETMSWWFFENHLEWNVTSYLSDLIDLDKNREKIDPDHKYDEVMSGEVEPYTQELEKAKKQYDKMLSNLRKHSKGKGSIKDLEKIIVKIMGKEVTSMFNFNEYGN